MEVLSGIEGGSRPALPARVPLVDYRLLEILGTVDTADVLQKAEPALLAALANAPKGDIRLRTAAAEAALRLNALPPQTVADIYRRGIPNWAGPTQVASRIAR